MLRMIGPQSAYKLTLVDVRCRWWEAWIMDYSAAFRRFVAESLECRIAVNVVV
jgi:hypothetical protein